MSDEELNRKFNQMDKQLFKENLLKTIEELTSNQKNPSDKDFKFYVLIDPELTKYHNSADDFMRLVVFNNYDIPNDIKELDKVLDFLIHPQHYFPLWIDVSIKEHREDFIIFQLESSSRFRKPSQLQHKETNHPPFKAIY
jgi:hypothetical protein